MSTHPNARALVVELVTEELPPKALDALGRAFAEGIRKKLDEAGLLADPDACTAYATPRRLAVRLDAVLGQAPDQAYAEKLMPASIGLDAAGAPTPALLKKLQAKGLGHLGANDLARRHDGKQDVLYAEGTAPGAKLADGLQQALDYAASHLPIPKVMQYQLADGRTSVKFVRPAQRLLALWGTDVVPVHALGLEAGRITLGHRFLETGPLSIESAETWADRLASEGRVVPSFAERRALIARQLAESSASVGATIGQGPEVEALLDEVAALVEYPTVYVGAFEEAFLAVPPECLILTMRLNQKYFPLFDPATGALTHRFLIVSNMQPADPTHIIQGNQRVVRPRLADAQFFYQTDLKTPLIDRVADLANSVYHNKLGTQLQRTERVRKLARWLAPLLGGDPLAAARAAMLAHADLGTQMVGEFPELQGIMGAYYAAHDGEPADVVRALRDQYRIRLDEPVTDDTLTAAVLFMAERAETLVGIWGIGLAPTGERDPYGLRRAALGLISAYEQLTAGGRLQPSQDTPARLAALLEQAADGFAPGQLAKDTVDAVLEFVYERYRNQLAAGSDRSAIDAVLALRPPLHQVAARVQACERFATLPEAESLAAANKRVSNLLKKADDTQPGFDPALLTEPAERQLADTIARLEPQATAQLKAGDFTASLATLAQARTAVDAFFTDVMVMAEDARVRANRLALLRSLHGLMNQVADLSRLAR
ncbi:glycine--tRNA ligase subunit beta [Castellaniella daejeonensis]|jgi:glycyl-tRNA synthetase beta chain|uniref:Glycine--tRNA ligase beta subunit n=1 Tax=Castellaniella daejeonensis TaxID=659013 RepID=A0ABN0T949_9BURK|nr:glycine--tRNA ligase subunit beta [Castellaniella sp.]HET8703734.1 glycine--tRNA ligase subunit beta [Castellaniella sp.]